MIKQVAIVGGTHGNEFTGIYLLKKWQQQPVLIQRESFNTETLFANPLAYEQNRRYVDNDLNRRFSEAELAAPQLSSHEERRAKEINQLLGPKGDPRCDFLIDLHTTTSNMGPTLLLTANGPFYNQLAAYAKQQMPDVVIVCDEDHKSNQEHHLLSTICEKNVIVEVGPAQQSVLRQDVFELSERLTGIVLDFIHLYNTDQLPELTGKIEAYRYLESLTLPLNEKGDRLGMVHANVQDRDFQPIHPGDPIFRTFDGKDICYQGDKVVYPSFINEAAYYDNNLAMSLSEKVELECL